MSHSVELLLTNARVITFNPQLPFAEAVAIGGNTITAVGSREELSPLAARHTRTIDCQGLTLLPGFVDSHCHLLALASSLTALDCRAQAAPSVAALQGLVRLKAEGTLPGEWIRGYGYDDLAMAEGRHPNRHDLDAVTPHHPVRLEHRSGHATVLNSLALKLAGIDRETVEPPEGVIDRDEVTGEPTGLLLEMGGFLRHRLGASRSRAQREEGIDLLDLLLLRYGITSVQDAGPENDLDRWRVFQYLKRAVRITPRITMMAGATHLDQLVEMGIGFGGGDDQLGLGHAKLMLTMTTGALHPGEVELEQAVSRCHRMGFPVAIHAVEKEAVAAAARALSNASGRHSVGTGLGVVRDRIEHCSECPPNLVQRVGEAGATVVTQPGFIYWNGDRYKKEAPGDLLPHIYPIYSLVRAGVPVAFGSDAPVIDPNPWPGIYAALSRTTEGGNRLPSAGETNQLSVLSALGMYTVAAARAEGAGRRKGALAEGYLADMTLVDGDPTRLELDRIKDIKAVMTMVDGKVAWDSGVAGSRN